MRQNEDGKLYFSSSPLLSLPHGSPLQLVAAVGSPLPKITPATNSTIAPPSSH